MAASIELPRCYQIEPPISHVELTAISIRVLGRFGLREKLQRRKNVAQPPPGLTPPVGEGDAGVSEPEGAEGAGVGVS